MKCDYEGCDEWSRNTDASGISYCRKHSHLLSHIEEIVCPKGCRKLTYKPDYIRGKASVENIRNNPAYLFIAAMLVVCAVFARHPVWLLFAAGSLYAGATQKQDIGKGKYVCEKKEDFSSKDGCLGVLIDSKSMSSKFTKENYERIISKINGEKNSSLTCPICNQKMEHIPTNYWVWVDNPIKYLPGWWREEKGDFDACSDCSMFWFGSDFHQHSQSPVRTEKHIRAAKGTPMKEFK